MAADIFLKLGDIKGESGDAKHKDEIEVLSWSWGVQQPGSMSSGGGGGVGKATFPDMSIMTYVDKATPVLMAKCTQGDHIDKGVLTCRKAGKGQQEYLIVNMKKVFITSVSPNGAAGGDRETVGITFQFENVDLEYKPQKSDGSLDASSHFKYDLKAQKEG